jgi:hypothetical protein
MLNATIAYLTAPNEDWIASLSRLVPNSDFGMDQE